MQEKNETKQLNPGVDAENQIQKEVEEEETFEDQVNTVIRFHLYTAMAVGLVPVPVVDFLGVATVQLNLLKNLAELYKVPYSRDVAKGLISTLVGATLPASTGMYLSSMTKFIPVFGQSVGAVSTSLIAGASTYAIGKVFSRHFSEGGTFLTLDPEKAKAFYFEMFKEGHHLSSELKTHGGKVQ